MTLIQATTKDVSLIRALAYEIWPPTFKDILSSEQLEYMLEMMYSEDKLRSQILNGHQFYLSFLENKPVGFMGVQMNYPGSGQLKVHKLYVLPQVQGKGVGRILLEKARELVLQSGGSEITLNVNRFNKAVEFYKRIGFEIEREEDIEIGNGYLMEDYVMTLSLSH